LRNRLRVLAAYLCQDAARERAKEGVALGAEKLVRVDVLWNQQALSRHGATIACSADRGRHAHGFFRRSHLATNASTMAASSASTAERSMSKSSGRAGFASFMAA
jgi:hypothetical protein